MSSKLFGKNIKQERRGVDERLVNKYVNTLACLQLRDSKGERSVEASGVVN